LKKKEGKMQTLITVSILITSCVAIILCLVQEQPDSGMLFVSNSNSLSLFTNKKARGGEKVLVIATYVVLGILMALLFAATKI
jgi:protein translocase SecG subunit